MKKFLKENNTFYGGHGDDSLNGKDGKDTLNGESGNDTLNGWSDNDYLKGGSANDTFVFNTLSTGIDTITDFEVLIDKIRINKTEFGQLLPVTFLTIVIMGRYPLVLSNLLL